MITYKIHLIRHGITDGNLQGKYIGVTDLPLSPDGVNELLGLKGLIEYPNVKKVYTSPLLRARQSANIIFGDTEQMAVENLKEFDFGIFENKTAAELENTPEYKDFISGKISALPEGEDSAEWTSDAGRGYTIMITPSLYHRTGAVEVIDII